jgi:hypothetical protein
MFVMFKGVTTKLKNTLHTGCIKKISIRIQHITAKKKDALIKLQINKHMKTMLDTNIRIKLTSVNSERGLVIFRRKI